METPPSSPPAAMNAQASNGAEQADTLPVDAAGNDGAPFDLGFDFELGEMDMDAFLQSLQQSVPDVGRLFDGSLGAF